MRGPRLRPSFLSLVAGLSPFASLSTLLSVDDEKMPLSTQCTDPSFLLHPTIDYRSWYQRGLVSLGFLSRN